MNSEELNYEKSEFQKLWDKRQNIRSRMKEIRNTRNWSEYSQLHSQDIELTKKLKALC